MVLTAKDAIARHMQWKITLIFAIQRREGLSAESVDQIAHEDHCAIGQWLFSRKTLGIRERVEYKTLVARHKSFHCEMSRVAALINSSGFEEAEKALGPKSRYTAASHAIVFAIMEMDKVMQIRA